MFETAANKLRAARIKAGYDSAADVCRRFSWKYAAYVHHENGTRQIPKDAAVKYAAAYRSVGLKASDLLGLDEAIDVGTGVYISGSVAMGIWHDPVLAGEERDGTELRLPRSKKKDARCAVRVLDESVNREIGPGEFAIYNPIDDIGELGQYAGRLLLIETTVRSLVERSIRLATLQRDGRLKLAPHSTNPKFSGHLNFPCSAGSVALMGVVVGKYADLGQELSTKK